MKGNVIVPKVEIEPICGVVLGASPVLVMSYVCGRVEEFLSLRGDGTELVRLTVGGDRFSAWDGDYVFSREGDEENRFVRQDEVCSPLISMISCRTEYLRFHAQAGITPNSLYYEDTLLNSDSGDIYARAKERLVRAGRFREMGK
jgi:hypothetical protein